MAIDIYVRCSCWERSLCAPCPVPVALTDPDPERGYPGLNYGLDRAELNALTAWHGTCCPHGGWAIMERLLSTVHVSELRDGVASLKVETPTFDSVLEAAQSLGLGSIGPADSRKAAR